jgi:hypothetical protein
MSTKAADQEYKKIKREPVAVRMNTEVAALARQCAKEEYGSTEKLGTWLEDAIHHYAANRMDESRTTALLKILEESLFQRISVEVEGMHAQFTKRDNALEKRLANLMAVSAYESCLTEQILKESYITNNTTKARYEELRSAAARTMRAGINPDAAPLIEAQYAEIQQLREQYTKLRQAMISRGKRIVWLEKHFTDIDTVHKHPECPKILHEIKDFPALEPSKTL